MHPRLGAFRAALLTGWIVLSVAGLLYVHQKNIPAWAAIPIIAAFLVEYSFYLASGFEPARRWLHDHLSRPWLAVLLAVGAALPYLIYSIPTGAFHWTAFIVLCAMIAVVSFWYVALGPSIIADTLFLLLLAAIVLSHSFDHIYTSSAVKGMSILGHLMLIHTGALAALVLRGGEGMAFGFIPSQKELIIGVQYFFYFLPVGFPLALWLGVAHLNFTAGVLLWKTIAYFFGALWVTALSEEFFFRGLLQHWLTEWTSRPWLSLGAASILYGASHLGFRAFPNWKMAVIDSFLGCFCGLAFRKAGSIRASMVTHALVVTLWRTLFVS
ncbi:MAG TPA: CPBP family intramembrane glutamic endopeptidase [Bryobacteraceae bacterium]|nr:CPBP family intramembrane glutamic endopeptidase [Bryobacteraceae bacterium]